MHFLTFIAVIALATFAAFFYKIMSNKRAVFAGISILILIGFLITSCGTNEVLDVSQVKINFQLDRMDRELFDNSRSMEDKVPELESKYGLFFKRYCENMLRFGPGDRDKTIGNLKNFTTDGLVLQLNSAVENAYSDFSRHQSDLEDALKRYHYYFPDSVVPRVVTYISGINYPVAVTDSTLALGLDWYLGADFKLYEATRMPLFRTRRMAPEFLVKDGLYYWLQSSLPETPDDKTFLAEIIHRGKTLYTLEQLLPKKAPRIIHGYTNDQWRWLQNNEANIWSHFVSQKIFYTTKVKDFVKYLEEGPFTKGFDRNSPDQTGYYIGWRIVGSYMENHPEVTLEELIYSKNAKQILNESGYKPTR